MANSADPDQLTDLDLHCLQRQVLSGFSRTRVKVCKNTMNFVENISKCNNNILKENSPRIWNFPINIKEVI